MLALLTVEFSTIRYAGYVILDVETLLVIFGFFTLVFGFVFELVFEVVFAVYVVLMVIGIEVLVVELFRVVDVFVETNVGCHSTIWA